MDKNVFISKVEVKNDIKTSIFTNKECKKIVVSLFDKDGNEAEFSTNALTNEQSKIFQNHFLQMINCKNWTQAIYGPIPAELTMMTEGENEKVVALGNEKGLVLKNEVRFYNHENE